MSSQDFIELMRKLYDERYRILSKRTVFSKMSLPPSLKVTVVLEKDGKQITIQSSEGDFIQYVTNLRGVADIKGEHHFVRLKDTGQYSADTEHLIDEDHSKLKTAMEEIGAGKFQREYSPAKLIDELLTSKKNVKDVKFLPLKKDYHHILAYFYVKSKMMLSARKEIIKKYPETQKVADVVERLFLKSFRPSGNALSDYNYYKRFMDFDLADLADRMKDELAVADDTIKEMVSRGQVDTQITIRKMMNIYAHYLEILAPMINLIRISMEIKKGNLSPETVYKVGENIKILKSDPDCGTLFRCLDEQIRHSEAHANVRINKESRKVSLVDSQTGKGKTVKVYTFDELAGMINAMQNEFFPVVYPTIVLFDLTMLDLLLASREYKHLLLSLGNC